MSSKGAISMCATYATKQSYIQYKLGSEKKKLLIAVSQSQSKDHQEVVKVMMEHFEQNPTDNKDVAKSLREALLS